MGEEVRGKREGGSVGEEVRGKENRRIGHV